MKTQTEVLNKVIPLAVLPNPDHVEKLLYQEVENNLFKRKFFGILFLVIFHLIHCSKGTVALEKEKDFRKKWV